MLGLAVMTIVSAGEAGSIATALTAGIAFPLLGLALSATWARPITH